MKTLLIQSDSDIDLELISDLANKKGAKHFFVDDNILQEYIEDIGLANAMKSIDNDENETEFKLSDELINLVEKIDTDMDNGEFYTSEEIDKIVDSWN